MTRQDYSSDLSDAAWARLEPLLPPTSKTGRPREVAQREVVNAILYVSVLGKTAPSGPARCSKPRRGRTWHLDEIRVLLGGVTHWLWRAVNEHGEVMDVLLQEHRDTGAAKRFFRRVIDD